MFAFGTVPSRKRKAEAAPATKRPIAPAETRTQWALRLGRPSPHKVLLSSHFSAREGVGAAEVSFPASGGRLNIEGPVVVSRKGQARIERGHPWVFRSDVVKDGGATPGAVVRVAGVRGEPLGFALLVGELGDPAAHARARGEARRELPARPHRAGAALARHGGRGRRGVSRGARRGRRPSVARRRSLRRLPRDPDALAGNRAGQARDRGGARGAPEAAGHRRAQRPARADARGPGADRLGAARRGAGRRRGERGRRAPRRRPAPGTEDGPVPRPAREPPRRAPLRAGTRARRLLLRRRLRAAGGARGGRGDGRRPVGRGARAREGERGAQRHLQRRRRATPTSSTCCTSSTSAGSASTR